VVGDTISVDGGIVNASLGQSIDAWDKELSKATN
jgi:hypothetical protein